MKILVAAVGNMFHGDDGFGSEIIRILGQMTFPNSVSLRDFGMRSQAAAFALAEEYDVKILVDSTPRDERPGTVSLIEPDLERLNGMESGLTDPESTNPVVLLEMARSFGALKGQVFVVGCEPAAADDDNIEIALSEPVRRAVPEALKIILFLIADALTHNETESVLN